MVFFKKKKIVKYFSFETINILTHIIKRRRKKKKVQSFLKDKIENNRKCYMKEKIKKNKI